MRYPEIDPGFFVRNRQKLVSLLPDNAAVLVVSNDEMPDSGDETQPFQSGMPRTALHSAHQPDH